jgi:hypothetical protein
MIQRNLNKMATIRAIGQTGLTMRKLVIAGVLAALGLCAPASLPAQTYTTLANFNDTDGSEPLGGMVQGTDGNFYGTTPGTVF